MVGLILLDEGMYLQLKVFLNVQDNIVVNDYLVMGIVVLFVVNVVVREFWEGFSLVIIIFVFFMIVELK